MRRKNKNLTINSDSSIKEIKIEKMAETPVLHMEHLVKMATSVENFYGKLKNLVRSGLVAGTALSALGAISGCKNDESVPPKA